MRNFFRRLRESFTRRAPTRRIRDSSASQMAVNMAAADGSKEKYDNLNPIAKAAQDLKMDVGLTQRDNQYYGNLANRQEASQQALADMNRRRDRRRDRTTDDTTDTTTTTTETTTTDDDTDDTTVLDPVTDTALDTVEDISDVTFDNDTNDNITNYFDNTATSAVNTAAGIDTNIASALTTSVGEAEDEAISYMDSGTAANVVNTGGAQGLLAGDDEDEFDPFNRRKTLIGA